MQVRSAQELDASVAAIRYGHDVQVWRDGNTLRFVEAGEALDDPAVAQIDHFNRVVAERRYEKPLVRQIHGEVINAAADGGNLDGAHKPERSIDRHSLEGGKHD